MTDAEPLHVHSGRLHTCTGMHELDINVAASFLRRFCGPMLSKVLPRDKGLLRVGCTSVHTAFMRYPIDVVYIDAGGIILKCVAHMQPWRASASSAGSNALSPRRQRATHTLELAAGHIARLGIAAGDRFEHFSLHNNSPAPVRQQSLRAARQRGMAVLELAVVGPLLTMLGLTIIQYGMMFFAKNQINHGAFMAARAGSVGNASLNDVRSAYEQALVPMYGGGQNVVELDAALTKAKADIARHTRIEMLNPTAESFADWNDEQLQKSLNTGTKRVISNRNLAFKNQAIGATSGQTIQDANLIKLRITHGYKPVVPIVGSIYTAYLRYFDQGNDAFHSQLIEDGLIPIVNNVTVQMQSDAIEPDNPVSSPGRGNDGNPIDPGDPPSTPRNPDQQPDCRLSACDPAPPVSGGMCQGVLNTVLHADALFGFDKAELQPGGRLELDALITRVKDLQRDIDTIKVTGYTDPLGSEAHNLALSKARAQAVLDYLNKSGLKTSKVEVQGLGSADLQKTLQDCVGMGDAEQKACLAPNRRVVVELIPK